MNKNFYLYILFSLFSAAGTLAFAGQPGSSLDDKPSVDSSANAEVQVPAIPAGATASEAQSSYLYDLKKLIERSRENIKEVNKKIQEQAVLKRNQKREERAREYYEKGVELTNEGKLDDAREYFEKAIRITEHPEMEGYIKESQRRLRKQEEALHNQESERYHQIKVDENTRKEDVEAAYKEAVALYKEKKYHPAKDAFDHVDEIAPDYRATSSYLKILDQDIIMADAVAAKQQVVEIARQQKEAESARAKEKAMWLAQIEEKEKERKEAIDKQAGEVYDQAVELYKNKRYAEAKKKFEEVSWVIPDFKATMKYLARIDRDAQKEQERVAQEQQKALQEQRWEEEVERRKQEAARQHELEAKERQHKADLQEQAQFLYQAAVNLFDGKNMDEALEKFNDIEKLVPDFKSTKTYIARIEQWKTDQQKQLFESQQKAQAEALRQAERQRAQELKAKQAVVVAPVPTSVNISNATTGALGKEKSKTFLGEAISERTTNPVEIASSLKNAPRNDTIKIESSMPTQVKVAVSLEDQQKQAQDIAALAAKSAQLYHQIADIADDRATLQTKRKMAQVDEIMNNLRENKERLLRQMREEQWKRQQEESKSKQGEQRAQAEKLYQDGLEFLRSHDYAKAKIKFLALENVIPDYKSTRRYLDRIDRDLKQAGVEAVTDHEKLEAEHLKIMQDKENTEEMRRSEEEQEKQHDQLLQQQEQLKDLTQKASDINDDIIRLSKTQDYDAMKEKFTELENTVTSLTALKDAMSKQKDLFERNKELARESLRQRNIMLRAQKREDQEIHAYYNVQPLKEYRPVLSNQPSDADQYKRRDIMQEQNVLFSEGVDLYEQKKFTQAKLLFGELADQNDRRAEPWLKKVDRAITRELLKSQEGEERERTAFLAEQLRAQRELIIIQERERQRQKKLTEELERQKRYYEDDQLQQRRREETIKAQDRERRRQEEKRLRSEEEKEKQQAAQRFHKIESAPKPQPAAVVTPAPVPVVAAAVVPAPPAGPVALTPQQMQAQIDFSNKRKAFLDEQYQKEQREKERQARIKAAEDARQKRREERQKEIEHQKELRAQREAERQAKIKAEADAKAQLALAQAQKASQEEKHREEALRQQNQEREEKLKEEEIMRQETQRKEEMEREERQRQAQLEAQREAVRKELEDGVEAMYQEALSLFKQGDFADAADRFKDVQDILPGYKRTEQYMQEAHQKSLDVNNQKTVTPDPPEDTANTSVPPAAVTSATPASPPVSHQDNVDKALDLFDPNAK